MGKADREIVLESLGCFNDVASLATAIGLPEEMVGEQFAAYDRMADAARTEASLLSLLDNDDPDEGAVRSAVATLRSEEHTSELQSLMRISYAVFCLKKKKSHKSHL